MLELSNATTAPGGGECHFHSLTCQMTFNVQGQINHSGGPIPA